MYHPILDYSPQKCRLLTKYSLVLSEHGQRQEICPRCRPHLLAHYKCAQDYEQNYADYYSCLLRHILSSMQFHIINIEVTYSIIAYAFCVSSIYMYLLYIFFVFSEFLVINYGSDALPKAVRRTCPYFSRNLLLVSCQALHGQAIN